MVNHCGTRHPPLFRGLNQNCAFVVFSSTSMKLLRPMIRNRGACACHRVWGALILVLVIQSNSSPLNAEGVKFDRLFAPQDGLVSRYEEPLRQEICLNGRWKFQGDQNTEVPGTDVSLPGDWDRTPIKIPSPWNVNSFSMNQDEQGGDFRAFPSYPKEWEKLPAAWMERDVAVPAAWAGRRVTLHFGAVAGKLVVYVNGTRVGEGLDIFFAQDFEVT